MLRRLAPAKINLALHVTGQREDGFHLLDSLVCFADFGDAVTVSPASELSLTVTGPMAADVPKGSDNLILRAAGLFGADKGAAISLEKNLPVASGIGGGSTDAAAALHLLSSLWDMPLPDPKALLALGADVPVCVIGNSARMRGIGEEVTRIATPQIPAVLVNPCVVLSTPAVFKALKKKDNSPLADSSFDGTVSQWMYYLMQQRNDLQEPAHNLVPEIGECICVLTESAGCGLARMSGSGASCFGLYETTDQAQLAARQISANYPNWWVKAMHLGE
jgi:4-diphosphocytidyl-2-C-methyl-D-erythritol kinase